MDKPLTYTQEPGVVHISSAYTGIPTADRHRLTCFVSHADFRTVFSDHLPIRGMQDKILGGLFYAFTREFESRMLANPAANPNIVAVEILDNIKFVDPHSIHPETSDVTL